jgi:hypothetical protein
VVFVLQQREIEFTGERFELLEELLRLGVGVGADSQNLYPLLFLPREKCFQLPELKRAVRSPMAAIEDQHDVFLAPIVAQGKPLSIQILQSEVGRLVADLDPLHIRRGQLRSAFRAKLSMRRAVEK